MDMRTVEMLEMLDDMAKHYQETIELYLDALEEFELAQLPYIHGKEPTKLSYWDMRDWSIPPKHMAWKDTKLRRTAKPWGDRVKPDYKQYNMGQPLRDPLDFYSGLDLASIQFVINCTMIGRRK